MISWIIGNAGTILAALMLAAVVGLAAASVIRDKRNGKSACGSNCAHCAMAGKCHQAAAARQQAPKSDRTVKGSDA